jgi:hypothetical protein
MPLVAPAVGCGSTKNAKLGSALVCVMGLFLAACGSGGGVWLPYGSSFTLTGGDVSAVALDANGNPLVLGQVTGSSVYLAAAQWTGSTWAALGTAANGCASGAPYGPPSLAFSSSLGPLVVFTAASGSPAVGNTYVCQWSGSTWQPLGGQLEDPGNHANAYERPAIALDRNGMPWVTVADNSLGLVVKTWNGSGWVAAGGPLAAPAAFSPGDYCPIRIDSAGRPIVVWRGSFSQGLGTGGSRLENGAWVPLSGAAPLSDSNLDFVLGANDLVLVPLVVAYGSSTYWTQIYQWDGTGWSAFGPLLAGADATLTYANALFVAGPGGAVFRWTGTEWSPPAYLPMADSGPVFASNPSGTAVAAVWNIGVEVTVLRWSQ